jgi:hypothetical protein
MFVKICLWLILLAICWPLALLLIIFYPILWLLFLPLRIIGVTVEALFAVIRSIFMLPARVMRG